jgi:F0F1-type ATP synthase membrane subunit b/b'
MLILLADADAMTTVSNWTNTGAFGVLAGIIWYFGYKVIPGALDSYRETGKSNAEAIKALTQECQATTSALMDRHDREMARRDACQDKMAESLQQMALAVDRYAGRMEKAANQQPSHS